MSFHSDYIIGIESGLQAYCLAIGVDYESLYKRTSITGGLILIELFNLSNDELEQANGLICLKQNRACLLGTKLSQINITEINHLMEVFKVDSYEKLNDELEKWVYNE